MSGNRLLGASAVMDCAGAKVVGCDMSGFVRRLLLFDKYIVVSVRLLEFRHLAQHLGYARTRDLLASGLIEIRNECVQMGDTGRSGMFGLPILPLMHYRLDWLEFHDREAATSDHLYELRDIEGISGKENIKLRGQIVSLINPLPHEAKRDFGESFFQELNNTRLVKEAIRLAMRRLSMAGPNDFVVKVERHSDDVVRIETDLVDVHGLSIESVHTVCQHGLLAVSSLAQQIGEMSFYKALSGFQDGEESLFKIKYAEFLASRLSSSELETDFQRVLEVNQLPGYNYEQPVDIERLLKVRDMEETCIFRDWLHHGGAKSEVEIREMCSSWRKVLGIVLNDRFGKGMRFLYTTAAGFAPGGTILGPAASIADIVLGELFPRPGVTAFIHDLYLSLFRERRM